MLSVIRELAEEAESPRHAALARARALPGARRARRGGARADAGAARRAPRGGRRRRGRRRPARDRPRDRRRPCGRARSGRARRGRARGRHRRDPPGALAPSATARSSSSRARSWTPSALEAELERLGDSLLVVGDTTALKIHVHTDEPGAALALATAVGTIEGVEIANMHKQTASARSGSSKPCSTHARRTCPDLGLILETGVVAVVPGAGNRRLFESYGATRVIEGGQTMNPSTEDIVEAIEATPATEVLVLPNNSNVILSAEQAAQLATKPVRVIPSRSVQAGLAAIVRYLPSLGAAENEAAHAGGARAGRDGRGDDRVPRRRARRASRCARARTSGSPEGEAVASSADFDEVAFAVVERLLGAGREVLTILTGADEPELAGIMRAPRAEPSGGRARRAAGRPAALSALARGRIGDRRGRQPIRILLVEDNDVFRQALELLLGLAGGLRGRGRGDDGTAVVAACRDARSGRRRDGLPPAGNGRRRGDRGASRGASRGRGRLPHGVGEPPRARRARAGRAPSPACRKDQALDEIVGAVRAAARPATGAPT